MKAPGPESTLSYVSAKIARLDHQLVEMTVQQALIVDESLEMIENESLELIEDESLEMIEDGSLEMIKDESLDMIVDETLKLDE
ncbi:hypothetical protein Tco_0596855 [Tanacetum coccineum]